MLIDPFRFARAGEQLVKVIDLNPEGRLDGIIAAKCNVSLLLKGSRNEANRLLLEGNIEGFIDVQCQVCLESMQLPVDIAFRLLPVSSEQQAERLQDEFEPIVIEDNSLALSELVINELILSLPVTFSHIEVDGRDCARKDSFTAGMVQEEKKTSPFAVLKSIQQKES